MKLTLVRGLPGSGKSTFAKTLNGILIEADQFCYKNGVYSYNTKEHIANHALCLKMVKQALKHGSDVIVANTFIKIEDMIKYFEAAKSVGAEIVVVCMKTQYEPTKDIPLYVISKMRENFEPYDGEKCIYLDSGKTLTDGELAWEKNTNLEKYRYLLSAELAQKFTNESISVIEKTNSNSDFYEVLGAICCLTGRRPSEVLRGLWSFEQREFYLYAIVKNASETIEFPIFEAVSIEKLKTAVEIVQRYNIVLDSIKKTKQYYEGVVSNDELEAKIRKDIEQSINAKFDKQLAIQFCTKSNELKQPILHKDTKYLNAKMLRAMYAHFAAYKLACGRNVMFEGKVSCIFNFLLKILCYDADNLHIADTYYCEMEVL